MPHIYLLSKNKDKLVAASSVFDRYHIELRASDLVFPEIQADTSAEIARHTALWAYEKLKKPVIREDHSLFIDALGIPGPYAAYIEKRVSLGSLQKILSAIDSHQGHFELAAAYINHEGKLYEFSYTVPIIFRNEPRGDKGALWNQLISFPGDERTFAEYTPEERTTVWTKNYEAIAQLIIGETS